MGKLDYLCCVLFTQGRLQVYLDPSFVRTRKVEAYEEKLCLGISCFERDVLYQIVYFLGLPEICARRFKPDSRLARINSNVFIIQYSLKH